MAALRGLIFVFQASTACRRPAARQARAIAATARRHDDTRCVAGSRHYRLLLACHCAAGQAAHRGRWLGRARSLIIRPRSRLASFLIARQEGQATDDLRG